MLVISNISHWFVLIAGTMLFISFFYAALIFLYEKEKFAFKKALVALFLLPVPFILSFLINLEILEILLSGIFIIALILFFVPFKTPKNICDSKPKANYDERDIMFSRKELLPGSERYKEYYARNPHNEIKDNNFRIEPGLLSPNAKYFNSKAFAAANASFATVDLLHKSVDGEINNQQTNFNSEDITAYFKNWALQLGALDVGIASIEPYHFYSVKGRGESYGQVVQTSHKYAIAFTVEMSHEMVMPAPQASIVMESAKQYLDSARIAVQLASFIREMGYNARAHIDGNYQVVCPLVGRDAGLGEIGRMGLLMSPKYGPRVRIGVVTTDLELIPHNYRPDNSVLDFCLKCKKCADCCPSQSIDFKAPGEVEGIRRWKIDSESCFTYWCKSGTDCGRCMAVCPYSHPNQSLHNFIRWGIRKSRFFRILAVWLDDYFFSKKPKPHSLPEWLK